MPFGMSKLVRAITNQIDEETIDETLDNILEFLSSAFVHVERIRSDEEIEIENAA